MRRIELKTVRIAFGLALGLPVAAAFAACSPTAPDEAEILTKFDEVLVPAQACELPDPEDPEASQENPCVLVYPGCPLGQFAAVHRDQAATVDEAARSLLRQYALEDQVCAYQGAGVTAPNAICDGEKCVIQRVTPPEDDAGG